MSLEALEQTSAIRILVFLLTHEKVSRSEIINGIKASHVAIYNAIRKLKEAGLVVEETERDFPFRVFVMLTEKGRRVAEHLAEVEKILAS